MLLNNSTRTLEIGNAVSGSSSGQYCAKKLPFDARTSIGSNSMSALMREFFGAITALHMLPEDHELYVSEPVVNIASHLVSYLTATYGVDVPKLLPESKDCLSLTWAKGSLKRFLAVYEDAVDLTVYDKSSGLSCHDFLCDDEYLDFDTVGYALGGPASIKNVTAL